MEDNKKQPSFSFKEALGGLKRVISHITEFRKEFIILCALAILVAILDPLATYFFSRIIKGVTDPTILFGIIPATIGFFVLWTFSTLLTLIIERVAQLRGKIVDEKARINFLATINDFLLRLPLSFHKNYKTGELGDKVMRAASAIPDIFSSAVVPLVPQILSIFIILGISFFVNWIFGIIFLVGASLYILSIARFAIPNAFLQRKMQEMYIAARGRTADAVANVRAVKDFTAEKHEHDMAIELFERRGLLSWISYITHITKTSTVQRIIIFVTRSVTLLLSLVLILQGKMALADMVLLNAYIGNIFSPLAMLSGQWRMIQNGTIALEDAEKIFKETTENYVPDPSFDLKNIEGKVSFKEVSFSYHEGQQILEGISFEANPGEVIALVGESGVGKTTLVDLISAYNFPKSGTITIDGVNIRKFPLEFLRSRIAVVPQETVLFNETILNNLRYGNFKATDDEVYDAARKAHCFDFIQKFPEKWESKVGERGLKLSVGQKQRISIARAILRDPRILILDEPTSALDAGTEKIITESLEELMKDRTTFIIAHRLSTVRRADLILVFKGGRIVETGTHADLIKKTDGEYKRLYDLQVGMHE